MGLKLTNFHVYKGDIDEIKNNLSDKYITLNISKDWTSILLKSLFYLNEDPIEKAFELSSNISQPVLFFSYCEEYIMGMGLIKDGDMIANFGMLLEEENEIDNLESFIDEFDLGEDGINRLNNIIDLEDHYKAMQMLEELFGVALEIAEDFIDADKGLSEFVRERQNR